MVLRRGRAGQVARTARAALRRRPPSLAGRRAGQCRPRACARTSSDPRRPGRPRARPDRPLYPGLRYYDTADAPVFFGRRSETEELATLVRALRVQRAPTAALVVGGSGSGKSSLVRAGLVPLLVGEGWWPARPSFPARSRWPPPRSRWLGCGIAAGLAARARSPSWLTGSPRTRARSPRTSSWPRPIARTGCCSSSTSSKRSSRARRARPPSRSSPCSIGLRSSVPVAVVATMRVEYTRELLAEPSTGALREHLFPLAPLSARAVDRCAGPPGWVDCGHRRPGRAARRRHRLRRGLAAARARPPSSSPATADPATTSMWPTTSGSAAFTARSRRRAGSSTRPTGADGQARRRDPRCPDRTGQRRR